MLKFAFKVTMLALYMIRYRINLILDNSSSYNEGLVQKKKNSDFRFKKECESNLFPWYQFPT